MANLNTKAQQQQTYDAIVVGSGITGGWAAKELTEKGLKTLVLERGSKLDHIKDYTTTSTLPWQFDCRGHVPLDIRKITPSSPGYMLSTLLRPICG